LDLIQRFDIGPPRNRQFSELIAHVKDQLNFHDKHKDELTPKARRGRRTEVQQLAKAFGAVESALAGSTPMVRSEIRRVLADMLGHSLSVHAFEQAREFVSTEVSIHTPHSREGTRREGPYRALEAEVARVRCVAARRAGDRVLDGLCHGLREKLEAYIEREKQLKIEFRGDPYRRIVLTWLADGFEEVFDRHPTPTEGGRFVKVCDAVLGLFDLPTEGLVKAIERVLKAMRR
jgi:hypothetical protein